MSETDPMRAFHAMVKQYEDSGWDIRLIDRTTMRAMVRARIISPGDDPVAPTASGIAGPFRCRKLWVDSHGQVQETGVPC
jgi:hypothetical protein